MALHYSEPWLQFLSAVEDAKADIGFEDNEECFYRGHRHTSYSLLPGLYRSMRSEGKRITDALWNTESDLFYEFRAKGRELHNLLLNDWDILFFMQHHGVRTRLLDWTESLGVAVYFALLNYDLSKSEPCVWLMNPYKLNEKYHGDRDLWDPLLLNYYEDAEEEGDSYGDLMLYKNNGDIMPWDEPIALYPVRRADRLATQSGYFTLHGNDSRPIEKIVPARSNIVKKVDIPKAAIPSAFAFLDHAGINQFTLFPDLDGLSRSLNHKYFEATELSEAIRHL